MLSDWLTLLRKTVSRMTQVLQLNHVSRAFNKGRTHAVRDVSLTVRKGEILGLVGVNGAGKTTIVKMCSTLLMPTSGDIKINGIDAVRSPEKARGDVGLVIGGDRGFYPRATVLANMRFFADLAGVSYRHRNEQISQLLKAVSLEAKGNSHVNELSRGQKQRLHIARALLGNPSLLLLDEPTIGLDPDVALQMRDLIRIMSSKGVGILLTSHSMVEVEELANKVAVLDSGVIRVQGELNDIYRYAHISRTSTFSFTPSGCFRPEAVAEWFAGKGQVIYRAVGSIWFFTVLWNLSSLPFDHLITTAFQSNGLTAPVDIYTRKVTLEDAFLSISQKGVYEDA